MHRDHKPQGFFWLDHRTVDGKCNFILDTWVTPGNVNDAQPYIERLDYTCELFQLSPLSVGLDAGYFQAPICYLLEQRDISAVFGYRRPQRGPNAFQKRDFRYDAERDCYICPAGQSLSHRTISRDGYHHYHTSRKTCQACPLKTQCTRSPCRIITRHIWEASKERANAHRLFPESKAIYRRRCETVERSFADGKQHHGHRYARFRGRSRVQMQCLLAATAQNIKKLALLLWKGLNPGFLAETGQLKGCMVCGVNEYSAAHHQINTENPAW